MHSFEVSLGYESVDRGTFDMKLKMYFGQRYRALLKMYFDQRFHTPMKLQKNAFNS
jgi:hypothetical protein